MPPGGYQEIFDERGRGYDDAMRRWPHVRDEELAFAASLARVRAGDRVLDVPAGGGYLDAHLPDGAVLTSVEPSRSFAARSRARGLVVVESPLSADAVPAGSVDVLVSIAGIHHEPDHDALLAAWRRPLAAGGRLAVADVAAGSPEARFLDEFVGRHNGEGHAGCYLGDDLGERAEAVGYTDVAIVDGRYHWWAATLDELAAFCAGLFGLSGVTGDEVGAALVGRLGVDRDGDRVGLRWGLRGLVATSP